MLNLILSDFTKPSSNENSRLFKQVSDNENIAHVIADFCKEHGITPYQCGLLIIPTRKKWKELWDKWRKEFEKNKAAVA